MATVNNITGDEIQSKIYSAQARDQHETIFRKRTLREWDELYGFDTPDETDALTECTWSEYMKIIKRNG